MAASMRKSSTSQPEMDASTSADRIVISGMSGLFPSSHNVMELADVLYNKKNPISTNPRWKHNHPEVAPYMGKIPDLNLFDAQFFKVNYRLGHTMDSVSRKILEQAFQAIYDAGVCPGHLSGKKVGVYIGACFSESEKVCVYDGFSGTGLGITGCNKSMFANRISYWLNAKGPSMSFDVSCCSSIAALEQAYYAMSRGDCEAAIVGGGCICLHPQSSVHYGRLVTMSNDGNTKSFDEKACGYTRSEAINVLFLQRAKDALRIYADLINVKSEFISLLEGKTGPIYGYERDPVNVSAFLNNFYEAARVSPHAVEYVEAFGSAIPEVDKSELEAIDDVFCKDRKDQLFVGSVMSNIGYGEGASGISAVTKVLLGYHTGQLAANLNCENPRFDIEALRDGRMRVLTEHQSFNRTYAAVNSLSFTGDRSRYKSNIPHLVTVSARQDVSVIVILDDLKSRPVDPEELALFHNIHQSRISGHLGRGFTILDTDEEQRTVSLCEKADYFDDAKRPLWFVYSGMGSQWTGMGTQLMRIPIFTAAIERCHRVLEPKGVDIFHIITSPDKSMFDNILNSFVGIAAIQIGLTDVLRELGLVPDKIIGHSVGELGCAYADGCFTAEEMILAAYYRGLVSVQTPFICGSMAAVGIGYNEVSKICPTEIEVACHNGPESSTISGPANIMKEFVAQLTAKQIFAKEVPCSNIAYHSRYIAEAGPGLLKYLSEVIKSPKSRSERWLSTSVPQDKWNKPFAKYSSAEYHTNNLLNPVLFEETSRLIPSNAVLVEIAPHGLLQAILKRSLPDSCTHVPLTRRGHSDSVLFLLEAVGKLYMEGYNPKVQTLYPKIEFPVSTGTPLLSHHVKWVHHEKWKIPLYASADRKIASSCTFVYSVHDLEHNYLTGNNLRGKNMFPFAAALVAVWDVLAMTVGVPKKLLSVEFKDVKLQSQPILHDQRQLRLCVRLHRGTGYFEIMDDHSNVATGYIIGQVVDVRQFSMEFSSFEGLTLISQDIYQILYKIGYDYRGEFQSIHSANKSFTEAQISWNNNWVTLIDALLQLNVLRRPRNSVSQPTHIRKIIIDLKTHFNSPTISKGKEKVMTANFFELLNFVRCGGVLVEDVVFRDLPTLNIGTDLMALKFVPYFQENGTDVPTALIVFLQIVAENLNKNKIDIIELCDKEGDETKFGNLIEVFKMIPAIEFQHRIIPNNTFLEDQTVIDDMRHDLLLVTNLYTDDKLCRSLIHVLCQDSFIVNKEYCAKDLLFNRPSALYRIVSAQNIKDQRLELMLWRPTSAAIATSVFTVRSPSDLALLSSTQAALPQLYKLIVIDSYPSIDGLKDLVKKWRKDRNQIYLVMINKKNSENQKLDQLPNLDLAYNVLDNTQWGGEFLVPVTQNLSATQDITLRSSRIGDFNSLHWVENPYLNGPGVKVTVHFAGLNDTDAKRFTGIIPRDGEHYQNKYGMDFSGVTENGDRVMGLVSGGAVGSRVLALPKLLWPVPEYWSLEEAATVPLAYCFAFYCLGIKYKLQSSARVLVHGGAGALGQAVISIALGNGCKVFTTVSDVNKKLFLLKMFPELKDDQIGNSRDNSFGDMVLSATNGYGCDIAISCVSGNLKNIFLKCSRVMFDTVQIPTRENFSYGMYHMFNDRTYIPVDFSALLGIQKCSELSKLQLMVSEGIKRGYVRPLSRVTYATLDAPRAFRLLATSRHRGRVLLQIKAKTPDGLFPRPEPRLYCSPDSSHLILCNSDYFGLRIAERLVSRGARNIYLHGLKQSEYLNFEIRSLEKLGVQVKVCNDILKRHDVTALLNACNDLGTIEGVYVIATEKQSLAESSNVIKELDTASRKSCRDLKYFGVININEEIGLQTCVSRAQDKLPGTLIILPEIKKMGSDRSSATHKTISEAEAVAAFESALRSNETVIKAHARPKQSRSLLKEIANVAGIEITDDVAETFTFSDLDLAADKIQIICTFLRDIHDIYLSEEDVPNLTVHKIREIEDTITDSGFKESKGLDTFFSHVDPDELLMTNDMTFLPSLVNNSTLRDDEFDVTQTYLCIIPGLEGHHERFRILSERLKLPALILQPGLDRPDESISNLAQRYAKTLLKKLKLKRNFYLMGYESGIFVALEIAAILEDHGLTGTVYCVGGAPEDIHNALKEQLKEFDTAEALQLAVVRHMYKLMVGGSTEGLENELSKTLTWEEKVETCVRSIFVKVEHTAQYVRELIIYAYSRIKQAQEYVMTPRELRSKLILLRAALSPGNSEEISLQRHSKQPVIVYELRAPLAHCAADLRCSAIINRHLKATLLEEFEKKNICDTYLICADKFMTTDETFESENN